MLMPCFLYAQKSVIRIVTGGIRHESNTFCYYLTKENNFKILRGQDALQNLEWSKYLLAERVEVIPTLHAYASPNGIVEKKTFDKFKNEIIMGIKNAGKVDGVFIDMHGALEVEGYVDAQVNFITEIREIVGDKVLICGSFDLHGNISAEFVTHINILTAYRTAPHIDGEETRLRAVKLLLNAIRNEQHPEIVHISVPIMVPGEKAITFIEPLKSLYGQLPDISKKEGLLDASIFVGYAWGDEKRSAMSVQVVARDSSFLPAAKKEAERLALEVWNARTRMEYEVQVGDIDNTIYMAQKDTSKTVFISDSGDNTTAGAAGDIPLFLEKLIAHNVKDAVVAGIADKEAVEECMKAETGKVIELKIGGKLDTVFGKPLTIKGKIINIYPTRDNQKAAVVDVNGILVVLLSERRSFVEIKDFQEVNIDPLQHKIVVVKLGYLFPELREIAPKSILALTPGMANQDIASLPYKNVQRPIYPLDPDMRWKP
jgi:microcystin degradation protein MlrC